MRARSRLPGRHWVLAALLAAASVTVFAAPAPDPARLSWRARVDPRLLTEPADEPQEILIVLAEQADLSGASALATKAEKGRYVFERLTEVASRTQKHLTAALRARGVEPRSFWITNLIGARADRRVIEDLARRPEVARVEGNAPVSMRRPAPEAAASGARRAPVSTEWNLLHVGAPEVWAEGFTGEGVVVGVADTGVEWTHPALTPHYRGWNGAAADHAYSWHDAIHDAGPSNPCGSDSPEPCDDSTHGTHVTGIAVGDDGAGNQIGMAPGARWIGCRNMDDGVGTPARYIECFQWFLAPTDAGGQNPDPSRAPDVVNNSWSCPPGEGCTDPDVLRATVESLRAAGIAVVVSAGNDGPGCSTVEVPALYDASIAVGSSNDTDGISGSSARGPAADDPTRVKPDIVAPGSDIRSSIAGGGYGNLGGTSMASPHVAGLIALLLSASPGLEGDVDTLETILKATSLALPTSETCGGLSEGAVPNNTSGSGRIDAVAALDAARCPPPAPEIAAPDSAIPNAGGLTASVTARPGHTYDWTLQGATLTSGQGESAITFSSGAAGTTIELFVTDSIGGCRSGGVAVVAVDFLDVPAVHPYHAAIAVASKNGISAGCGGGNYCPQAAVTRAEMAVFLLRAIEGGAYKPSAATGTIFGDVPPGTFLGDWIEDFFARGLTNGCGGGNFCPGLPVTRAGAAVFLLRGLHGASYQPPAASGTVFDDVPPGALLARWIERLADEGITLGCGGKNFCPNQPVTRGEMAVFLRRAFELH